MSQGGEKKCRHTNTQLWFGWKCGCLCAPVCCWEGRGMFLEKAETQWFLSLQWKGGLAKKGGVIYFTSVGSGGILGFSVRGKCLFTYTTFPVYSEHKSEVCACEFTIGIRQHVVFKICMNDWLCKYLTLLSSHLFPVASLCQGNVFFEPEALHTVPHSQPDGLYQASQRHEPISLMYTMHLACCILPLRLRQHMGTTFSILDVNHVTKLTTKSLTHHESFMKYTTMWLEKKCFSGCSSKYYF